MKKQLLSVGLVAEKTLHFNLSSEEFKKLLASSIDKPNTGPSFKRSKNEYNGRISYNTFYIKQNTSMFDTSHNQAEVEGQIKEDNNEHINVYIIVRGLRAREISLIVFGLLIFLFGIASSFSQVTSNTIISSLMGLIFVVFTLLYTRNAVMKMSERFERDIFFIVNNKENLH